ncbi:MAG: hypothetical protein JJU02_06685 [Cryomorphaceae bacterium]|nr:hypothetical protein [Cryomorphaceae bacterium]
MFFQKNQVAEHILYEITVDNNIDLAIAKFGFEESNLGQWSFFDGLEEKIVSYTFTKNKK